MKIRCASCAAVWWSAAQDALTLDNARKTPCDVIVCSWFGHVDFMRRAHTACVCCRGLTRRVCTGACQPGVHHERLAQPHFAAFPCVLAQGVTSSPGRCGRARQCGSGLGAPPRCGEGGAGPAGQRGFRAFHHERGCWISELIIEIDFSSKLDPKVSSALNSRLCTSVTA